MNDALTIVFVFFIGFCVWREWSFHKAMDAERLERETLLIKILELSGIKPTPKIIMDRYPVDPDNTGGLTDAEEAMIEKRRIEAENLKK